MLTKLSNFLEEQFPEEIRKLRELYFKYLIWKQDKKLEKNETNFIL